MFGDELVEEFAALCTDYEVQTFEVQGMWDFPVEMGRNYQSRH
jgi:hypothetical protein